MSFVDILFVVFHSLSACLVLYALFLAIQIFRGKFSWGQARCMGIPMTMFTWINIIFGLVLFEGLYGVIGFIINTPLWIDILLALLIAAMTMTVYWKLLHRDTFRPEVFTVLVLIPLGIPGIHMTGKLVRIGAVEIVQRGVLFIPKRIPHTAEEVGKEVVNIAKRRITNLEKSFVDSGKRVKFSGYNFVKRDKVFDPKFVDDAGRTNIERMKSGLAPIGNDGKSVELHHMKQHNDGMIVEVSKKEHTENSEVFHRYTDKTEINRDEFTKLKTAYWKERANDFPGSVN